MPFIHIDKKDQYAIVQINRGKVNAINHQLVRELTEAFLQMENDDSVGGVILTGIPRFFSAGLDVIELYGYDEDQIRNFMGDFGSLHVQMARFPKPLVCAINGHSPAGGTVLALTADYRIMAEGDRYSMGLNEVAVNILISQNLVNAYSYWIGSGKAHRYILEGKLLNTQEALACGLVDEVVPESELLAKAEKKMKHYLSAMPEIFGPTKQMLRKSWLEQISDKGVLDWEESLRIWWLPETRRRMKAFVDQLTGAKQPAG
ncbi:MAG: enoyl-CoA hydratase/isomerase family protein [Bacteroidota bacterium]